MVDSVVVKSIVAAIDTQYVKELKEDYVWYKNQMIKTMITHLSMWYFTTNK